MSFIRGPPRTVLNLEKFSHDVEVAEDTYELLNVQRTSRGRDPTETMFKAVYEAGFTVHDQLVCFLYTFQQ